MSCRIYEENDPEHSILLLEEWASATELCEQVQSDLYRRVLAAIELSSHAPEVSIHHVSDTEGLDFVRRLRIRGDSAPVE